jgi:hypothetical protein
VVTRILESIPGAQFVQIPAVQHITATVDYVFPNALVGCITGDIGVGKRTALRHVIGKRDAAHTWIDLPRSYTTKEVIRWLYRDIVGDPENLPRQDVQDDLITELTRNPRNIIIGNADRLTAELSGQLDWLHERSPGWGLLLVGKTGSDAKIAADPHLAAAVCELVTIKPLNQKQLLTVLPSIHQMFLGATPELLIEIDSKGLYGNLERWMQFLQRGLIIRDQVAQAGKDVPEFTRQFAKAVLAKIPAAHKNGLHR